MAKTTTNPILIGNASSLVTHGIYRFTRNPMYLGMLLIIISFIIKTGHVAGIVFALAFLAYMTRFQIKPEEQMLNKIFKEQYRDYIKRTRAWV
jgi:protein-S-isoprenylcysteine O-methyltransferase Ste14